MNKLSQIRLLYGLIIGIFVFSIITLVLISAPEPQDGKVIISPGINNLTSNIYLSNLRPINIISNQAITNNFKITFKNNTNLDSAVTFNKGGYSFTYDLSGGQMLWKEKLGQPAQSSTSEGGYRERVKKYDFLIK